MAGTAALSAGSSQNVWAITTMENTLTKTVLATKLDKFSTTGLADCTISQKHANNYPHEVKYSNKR